MSGLKLNHVSKRGHWYLSLICDPFSLKNLSALDIQIITSLGHAWHLLVPSHYLYQWWFILIVIKSPWGTGWLVVIGPVLLVLPQWYWQSQTLWENHWSYLFSSSFTWLTYVHGIFFSAILVALDQGHAPTEMFKCLYLVPMIKWEPLIQSLQT